MDEERARRNDDEQTRPSLRKLQNHAHRDGGPVSSQRIKAGAGCRASKRPVGLAGSRDNGSEDVKRSRW
jgi:hypothetical protein